MAKSVEQVLQEQLGAMAFQIAVLTAENEKLRDAAKASDEAKKPDAAPPLLHKVN